MASISAEEASRLKPFIELIDKLGTFAGQITDDGLQAVEIEYEGEVARRSAPQYSTPDCAGIGLLDAAADAGREHGVRSHCPRAERYPTDRIQTRNFPDIWIADPRQSPNRGELADACQRSECGNPKIVEVKGMPLETDFHPVMLFINNLDKLGFIGALGNILAGAHINIATFHVGRQAAGQDAIAIVGVDQIVPEPIQKELRTLPHVRYVKVLTF